MEPVIEEMLKTQRAAKLKDIGAIEKALEMESTAKLRERNKKLKAKLYRLKQWANDRGYILPIE